MWFNGLTMSWWSCHHLMRYRRVASGKSYSYLLVSLGSFWFQKILQRMMLYRFSVRSCICSWGIMLAFENKKIWPSWHCFWIILFFFFFPPFSQSFHLWLWFSILNEYVRLGEEINPMKLNPYYKQGHTKGIYNLCSLWLS